jgi:hypothetical protein
MTIIKTLSEGSTLSLNVIRKIYNVKAEHQYDDPYPHIKQDIDKIKKLVIKRQWNQFFNPYVIELLIKIYNQRQNELVIPTMVIFIKKIETATAKVFTILSFIKLLSFYDIQSKWICILIGVISLLLIPTEKWSPAKLIIRALGVNTAILYNNYLLGSIICEYSYFLLNTPFLWVYNKLIHYIVKNYYLLIHYNDVNYYILLNMIGLMFIDLDIKNIIILFYIISNAKHIGVTLWFVIFGALSHYNIIHLILLGLIYYLLLNISHIKYAPKPKLKMLLLDNYEIPKNNIVINDVKIKNANQLYKPIIITNNKIIKNTYYKKNYEPMIKYMHNPKYIKSPL